MQTYVHRSLRDQLQGLLRHRRKIHTYGIEDTRVSLCSSEQDHRSQGWDSVCEIHKWTSKETPVTLCLRVLLGLSLHVSWKWTTRKLAQWTTNMRVWYPLGEPGVLGLGRGHHGRQNNKAEPLREPNFLISGTLRLAPVWMHSCFILWQVYTHTILLILYQRNREAFLMRKLQGGLVLMEFGIEEIVTWPLASDASLLRHTWQAHPGDSPWCGLVFG